MANASNFSQSVCNKDDELYTPGILVSPIIPYLKSKDFKRIWCPFDCKNSEFVLLLKEAGFDVIYNHIIDGYDFFKVSPPEYDCIVSNPPFSRKLKVFNRLYELNKPFAIIMGLPVLNYQEVGEFFYESGMLLQLLIVDKKVSFNGRTSSFNNSYFCCGVLPRDIIFCHLPHNNSGRHFVPSRMYDDLNLGDLFNDSK
jgi:hypothetical protein